MERYLLKGRDTGMKKNAFSAKPFVSQSGAMSPIAVAALFVAVAIVTFAVTALLMNIRQRKDEARERFVMIRQVDENTTDPKIWGENFPSEYDSYKRTTEPTHTRFGGGETLPASKLERDPWLKRFYAGYAFSLEYRDRRGHAYMLYDQQHTLRVKKKKQPGACLHCHTSIIPLYRYVGKGDVMKGFEEVCAMPYKEASNIRDAKGRKLVKHPVSCVDCHEPKTMALRVTRPGFINGIKAYKASLGIKDYDVNRDATRQEMRTYVCGQCHVEYYFKGDRKTLTYPWFNGLKIEQIEKYYDDEKFSDWEHKETDAGLLKAQHPEFEMYNQGIHARSGVACADCHMPYKREGARKVADHWVRSPLLNINRACQTCHNFPEEELKARVDDIQNRNHKMMESAAKAYIDMIDAIVAAEKAGLTKEQLKDVLALQRKAQFRLDFVQSENSMGFHAPQEAARILSESIDYSRQAEVKALRLTAEAGKKI